MANGADSQMYPAEGMVIVTVARSCIVVVNVREALLLKLATPGSSRISAADMALSGNAPIIGDGCKVKTY